MDDVSTDAEPVPPRSVESTHENESNLNETRVRRDRPQRAEIEIPRDPHDEWELNNLLEKIASSVTDEELANIKLLFRGPNGLRKRTLEKCNTCAKLFDVLRERQYILKGNIVYLNRILYVLNKPELIEEAAKYCRKEGNAVYYYSVEDESEDGSKCVKFHVMTELNGINQETVERLRNNVAKIVCAPLETVRVVAVEPSSSLLVSIVIPDVYVSLLEKLLKQKSDMWELNGLEVDFIEIGDKRYSVTGMREIEMTETEQQRKFMNVYQQLEQTRKELENTELQAVEYRESIKKLNITCETLQKMHLPTPDGEAALSEFRLFLHQANVKGQDMDLIVKLLETNTLLVSAYTRNYNEAQRKKHIAIWEEKASIEMSLWHLLLSKSKSAEEILMDKYSRCTLLENISVRQDMTSILFDICKRLNKEERNKLMQLHTWDEKDIVKACIDADEKLLLLGLECKEAAKTQCCVNSFDFMSRILKKIQREDLIETYIQKVKQAQLRHAVNEEHVKYAADLASRHFTEEQAEHILNTRAGTILKIVKPALYEEFIQK